MSGVKYSEIEMEWIREQYPNHSVKELCQLFAKNFRPITLSSLRCKLCKMGIRDKNPYKHLTEIEKQWLADNYEKYSLSQLASAFTERFGRKTAVNQISTWCSSRGLRKKPEFHKWNEAEDNFILENYPKLRCDDFVNSFNSKFGTHFHKLLLTDRANSLGAKASKLTKMAQTEKIRELNLTKKAPLGTERYDKSRGEVLIKVDDKPYAGGRNWRDKKFIVWEQRHGSIPDGMCVICLDGDNTNYDESNMMLVSEWVRHKFRIYNRTHSSHDRELVRTYIMAWQLQEMIGRAGK